jgi:hypothetical protein
MFSKNYLLPTLLVLLCGASSTQAQFKSEHRVFSILVENHLSGTYTQTITTYGEGTTDFVGKSDTKVKVLGITFQHAFRGNERWKEGKLIHMANAINDNGTSHTLQVNADQGKLMVKVSGVERTAHLEAWSSSYWTLPSTDARSKPSYMIDADTGIEYQVTWQNMGKDSLIVGKNRVACTHYRVSGNGMPTADVWFDENDRLVRRDGVRRGKPVVLMLVSSEIK